MLGYSRAVQLRNNWSSTTPSDATALCSYAPIPLTWQHFAPKRRPPRAASRSRPRYEAIGEGRLSQGLKQLGKERADWLVGVMADQDRKFMVSAGKEAMAFDSRRRLAEIK